MLSVQAVFPVHQSREYRHIGHLTAGHTGLHLSAAQVLPHLFHQELLHPVNEFCSLVIKHVRVIEGLDLFVLRVSKRRVRGAEELHRAASTVLRGNQIHTASLPPLVIFCGPGDQLQCLGRVVRGLWKGLYSLLSLVQNRPCIGRCSDLHMIGRNGRLQPPTTNVHLHDIVLQSVTGKIGKPDRALAALLQNHCLQALALVTVIGDHGAAGNPADLLLSPVDRHARAHHAPVQQGDGKNPLRECGEVSKIPVHDALECLILCSECLPAYKAAFAL